MNATVDGVASAVDCDGSPSIAATFARIVSTGIAKPMPCATTAIDDVTVQIDEETAHVTIDRESEERRSHATSLRPRLHAGRTRSARGTVARALAVDTGGGFAFTAIADRGLDVSLATYRGIPLCWRSENDIAAPAFCEPHGDGFLRTFVGGLFTTCGLGNFGPAGEDAWGSFGLHGRIDATPAENLRYETRWEGDTCILEISATFRETRVFGENLRLERRLRAVVGGRRLDVHDEVTNDGGTRHPHMLLYHCNGGFPILDERAELHVSHRAMHARDARAEAGIAEWNRGGPPDPTFAEQVFIHEPIACDDGLAAAILANPTLRAGSGLALAIRFDPKQLPALFTWRMLGHGTYVMGVEPANCPTIEGRVEAGKRGTLPFLEPGETRAYDVSFEVVESNSELAELLRRFPRR